MRQRYLIAAVLTLISIAIIFAIVAKNSSDLESDNIESPSSAVNDGASSNTYSLAEVAKHSSESDCWTMIDNKVYNVTSFISSHPGGEEILRACGKDATTLFKQRKTDSGEKVGSGTPHSEDAMSQLGKLQIGTLSN